MTGRTMQKNIVLVVFTLLIGVHLAVEQCEELELPCTNSSACRPLQQLCDNYEDCGSGRICEISATNLSTTCFLPEDSACKSHQNQTGTACKEGIENCLCSTDDFLDEKCFRCLSFKHLVIPSYKLCDGYVDCPDLSDECLCRRKPGVCSQVKWSAQMQPEIDCEMTRYMYYKPNETICNRRKECFDCVYDKNCSFTATRRSNDTGKAGKELELNYCKELAPKTKICNMHDNYYMHNGTCTHYYCDDDGDVKYFRKDRTCDGRRDCETALDECDISCVMSAFSDVNSMIKNKGLLVAIGLIGILAFVGNVIVIITMIRNMISSKSISIVNGNLAKLHAVMILNLSISDLLVAIYVLTILGKSLEFEGKYCLVDHEWRSSTSCSAIGALLVIGSEESVFTMMLITVVRMKAVLRPFSKLSLKTVYLVILMTWILSFAFALIPLIPSLEDYFVDYIWYRDNQIFSFIHQREVKELTNWLSFFLPNESASYGYGSWENLKTLITKVDPKTTFNLKYGFYSTHTVCTPRLLPYHETDGAWGYSLGLILLNFFAFFFIAVGYAIIFRETTKVNSTDDSQGEDDGEENSTRLQRKLLRIIASDFFCWIPVCLMAFCRLGGIDIPTDSYLPIGLIIIPINSALNPILYSNLPDLIWERTCRLKLCIYRGCCLPAFRGMPREPGDDVETENAIGGQEVTELQVLERTNDRRGNIAQGKDEQCAQLTLA